MATYYLRKTGSDANNGTTPATAWLTLGKALGASGIASGDTVYVGAGTYRETVTVAMTSAVAETQIVADVDGARTGDPGPVLWTAYTTNDQTAPAAASLLTLNGKSFLTFDGIYLVGGAASVSVVNAAAAHSTHITFRRCTFVTPLGGNFTVRYISNGTAGNWLIEKCTYWGHSTNFNNYVTAPTVAAADYDVGFTLRNCLVLGGNYGLYADTSGALANKGGGIVVQNSDLLFQAGGFGVKIDTGLSTTVPCLVKNCLIYGSSVALQAATSGQITEDYNLIVASTARANVTAGANSIADASRAPLFDAGYAALNGLRLRLLAEPCAGAPFLGFGNDTSPAALTDDLLGRPRPAGGGSTSNSIGCFERHDTGAREASVVDASAYSLALTGPADHDLLIPVDATATTITVRVRYDANHGTTNKPQAILLANGALGVSLQTATAAGGAGAWETLTLGPFTPTAKGWVTLRLVSRAAAGNGIAYFDTVTVS